MYLIILHTSIVNVVNMNDYDYVWIMEFVPQSIFHTLHNLMETIIRALGETSFFLEG